MLLKAYLLKELKGYRLVRSSLWNSLSTSSSVHRGIEFSPSYSSPSLSLEWFPFESKHSPLSSKFPNWYLLMPGMVLLSCNRMEFNSEFWFLVFVKPQFSFCESYRIMLTWFTVWLVGNLRSIFKLPFGSSLSTGIHYSGVNFSFFLQKRGLI